MCLISKLASLIESKLNNTAISANNQIAKLTILLFTLNQRESGNTTYNTCNITELMTNGTELLISKTIYNTHSTKNVTKYYTGN